MSFTMELAANNRILFLGIEIIKEHCQLKMRVHKKSERPQALAYYYTIKAMLTADINIHW